MLHHDPFSDCTEHVVEVLEAHALRLDMIVNNGRSLTAICAQRLGTKARLSRIDQLGAVGWTDDAADDDVPRRLHERLEVEVAVPAASR